MFLVSLLVLLEHCKQVGTAATSQDLNEFVFISSPLALSGLVKGLGVFSRELIVHGPCFVAASLQNLQQELFEVSRSVRSNISIEFAVEFYQFGKDEESDEENTEK